MDFIYQPEEIEARSMEIIERELEDEDLTVNPQKRSVIKRVAHATADPTLAQSVIISQSAVELGREALEDGCNIVTDVNMLRAGINSSKLKALGGEIKCFISDGDVAWKAKAEGITRSMMSMREAIRDEANQIFAIGNAPTALFELMRLIKEEEVKQPKLIVGTPVGFVGAKESKAQLEELAVPHITLRGRKGGSAVAASIMNALLYMD
ncbi:MAG: precorrin-8X methylmutase [Bacillota bacterium]